MSTLDSPADSSSSSLRPPPAASTSSKSQRSTADYSLSCAECRRLKLKCSRQQWPCDKCVKRGIAYLCPDGIQTKEKSKSQGSMNATSATAASKSAAKASGPSLFSSSSSPRLGSGGNGLSAGVGANDSSLVMSRLANLERKLDLLIEASIAEHQPGGVGGGSSRLRSFVRNGSLHDLASVATDHYALESGAASVNQSRDREADGEGDGEGDADQEEATRQQHGTLTLHADGRAHYMGSDAHSMYLARENLLQVGTDSRRVSFRDQLVSRPGSPTPIDLEAVAADVSSRREADMYMRAISPEGNTPSTTESQPAHLIWATPGFRSPFSSTAIWNYLKSPLPQRETARRLVDVYYASMTFMFHPITREDFDQMVWNTFYDQPIMIHTSTPPKDFHPHKLALLYSVLSLGVLLDVRRPQRDPVGKALYSCAWSALTMSNFTEATSLEAILSLMHINMYLSWRRGGRYAESAYPLLGTMMRLAISTGLHRDPLLFQMEDQERERRRRVFWDIQSCEVFRAFAFCRPPALCDRHVDTKLPAAWTGDEERGSSSSKRAIVTMMPTDASACQGLFHQVKCRQIQLVNRMLDECLCVKSTYQLTLEFDLKLRNMLGAFPPWMYPSLVDFSRQASQPIEDVEVTYDDAAARDKMVLEMQRHTTLLNHYQALLLLHRGWFSQALQLEERRKNSRSSSGSNNKNSKSGDHTRLSTSIDAVNESASSIVGITISAWCTYPALVIRWAFFWNAIFSAAVCRGLYVVKCHSRNAQSQEAWEDLQKAISLFSKAVVGWAPLESPLGILERLNKRAEIVMNGQVEHVSAGRRGSRTQEEEERDGGGGEENGDDNVDGEDLELIGNERKRTKRGPESTPTSSAPQKRSRRRAAPEGFDDDEQKAGQQRMMPDPEPTLAGAAAHSSSSNHLDPTSFGGMQDTSSIDDAALWIDQANLSLPNPLLASLSLTSSSSTMLFDHHANNDTTSIPAPSDLNSLDLNLNLPSNASSASASQLIQMLSSGLSWDDVSSWNDLIVDL